MSIIAGILGGIIAAATTIAKGLAVIGLAIEGLKALGNAIMSIAKALGLIKPDRDVEELGDRALQAEEKGITPDKFDSYQQWVKKIDEDDWGYDPEKNKDMDPEKKVEKGIEVSCAVTMEKYPDLPIEQFFNKAANNVEFFTTERMDEIGKIANTDSDLFGKIVKYTTGVAKDLNTVQAAINSLMDIEKTINPSISDNDAYIKAASYKGLK